MVASSVGCRRGDRRPASGPAQTSESVHCNRCRPPAAIRRRAGRHDDVRARSPAVAAHRPRRAEPSGQHRRRRARDADDGPDAARARPSAALSRSRGRRARLRRHRRARRRGSRRHARPGARGLRAAIGFSARPREFAGRVLAVREAAAEAIAHASHGDVALVFGTEMSGLSNAELARCGIVATIPANADYASLNLAAAVQVVAYELRLAATGGDVWRAPRFAPASVDEIEALYAHGTATLAAMRFLDPRMPKRLLPRLRRLFARAALEKEEVNILRGILARIDQLLGGIDDGSHDPPLPQLRRQGARRVLSCLRPEHAGPAADVRAVHARSDGAVRRLRRKVLEDARGAPVPAGIPHARISRGPSPALHRPGAPLPRVEPRPLRDAAAGHESIDFGETAASILRRSRRAGIEVPKGKVEDRGESRAGRARDARRRSQPQHGRAPRDDRASCASRSRASTPFRARRSWSRSSRARSATAPTRCSRYCPLSPPC